MKNFVFVQFNQCRTSDAVHKSWMVGNNTCLWPTKNSSVSQMVKDKVQPSDGWKAYKCKILCQANSYERCIEKAYKAGNVSTSSAGSDSEDERISLAPLPVPQQDTLPVQAVVKKMNPPKRSFTSSLVGTPPKKIREIERSDNTANVLHIVSSMRATIEKINSNTQTCLKQMNNMEKEVSSLKEAVHALMCVSHVKEQPFTFQPACTEEELAATIDQFNDFEGLGRKVDSKDIRSCIRRFIKAFMTKELAVQYSWTGLGLGRKKTKKSFKDSSLYSLLTNVLPHTLHKNAPYADVGDTIGVVLSQAPDWEGGRNIRRTSKLMTSTNEQVQSDSSTDTVPVEECESTWLASTNPDSPI